MNELFNKGDLVKCFYCGAEFNLDSKVCSTSIAEKDTKEYNDLFIENKYLIQICEDGMGSGNKGASLALLSVLKTLKRRVEEYESN